MLLKELLEELEKLKAKYWDENWVILYPKSKIVEVSGVSINYLDNGEIEIVLE